MCPKFLFSDLEAEFIEKPTNVALAPQRSPFRYPGGKTWLVPRFRQWMRSFEKTPRLFVDPFTGGGILPLTAAFENFAEKIIMVELDAQIAAVWQTVLSEDFEWLCRKIMDFEMTSDSVKRVLEASPRATRERGFQTILKNRTAHGGILADGAGIIKNGENGKGIFSRWYPRTITERINAIHAVAAKIEFFCMDGFELIEKHLNDPTAVFFIDPPYTAGGKKAGARLYNYFEIDHSRLFQLCGDVTGDFLMTYDNADEVCALAGRHGFKTKAISMKNTHHAKMNELLIGKNLDWVN